MPGGVCHLLYHDYHRHYWQPTNVSLGYHWRYHRWPALCGDYMRRANRAVYCGLGHVISIIEYVEEMENERLICAIVLVLTAALVIAVINTLAKSILKLLITVILVFILYSIFWGEGARYISLLSQVFPESVQEDIIQGYDYYRHQELLLPTWK